MEKKVKLASTIMLARDHQDDLEVLLLKRNKALAFAGGLWVFPGGKIEASELEQGTDELAAAKLAAVRETKEETNLDVDKNGLTFFRHWTTPVMEPRRYATYFFFGAVNSNTSNVIIDDSEIKQHFWVNPQVALDQLKKGKLAMMPPTLMSLQLICKCNSVAEVKDKLKQETPIHILPVLKAKEGKMICLYQGDEDYDAGNEENIGARHRLILDLSNYDFHFEYKNCGFPPVNGGMHL